MPPGLPAQPWNAEALWLAIEPRLPGFTVEVLPEVDSTNSEVMRRARAGQTEPVLLVAERQSAGRGRQGRPWHSAAATPMAGELLPALTFSMGLPLAPADWSGLSLAVGVAAASVLPQAVGIKWPNDLWLAGGEDRKLAGILIETVAVAGQAAGPRYAVIGMGLNIQPRAAEGVSARTAALVELWPEASAPAALARIAPALVAAVQRFEREGFAPFVPAYTARDVLAGRAVVLSDGTAGMAQGVASDGALLVHTAAGVQRITSSEVSVRPAPA